MTLATRLGLKGRGARELEVILGKCGGGAYLETRKGYPSSNPSEQVDWEEFLAKYAKAWTRNDDGS